jgi:hypothetical protein
MVFEIEGSSRAEDNRESVSCFPHCNLKLSRYSTTQSVASLARCRQKKKVGENTYRAILGLYVDGPEIVSFLELFVAFQQAKIA